jgi:hypothetical protein
MVSKCILGENKRISKRSGADDVKINSIFE